ncbi:MAG TPA: universal stress protein [Anaerolineales bacterium]|nr:universal stress protein [Anaerolineales bacterium]
MRWLIVIDGSDRSEAAAAFAAQLVRPGEDEILLLAVQETGTAAELKAEVARVQERFADFAPRTLTGRDPADDAVDAAAGEEIDVVVYGSRGRRGLSRLLLGSVAAHLEHKLPCSLLVVRGEGGPIRRILVATGLFPGRLEQTDLAGRFAGLTGAHVTVLHVMSQMALSESAEGAPLELDAEAAIRQGTREGLGLQERLEYLHSRGIEAEARLRHGLVLDEVAAEIKREGYDLLIIGGHRVPSDLPFAWLLSEDVADEILMNTKSHVLIV